jgi:hypothetical protein
MSLHLIKELVVETCHVIIFSQTNNQFGHIKFQLTTLSQIISHNGHAMSRNLVTMPLPCQLH